MVAFSPTGIILLLRGAYFYRNGSIATPWGPRYNYADPLVRRLIANSTASLMADFGAAGFRFDSTTCIRRGPPPSDAGSSSCSSPLPDGWRLLQETSIALREMHAGVFLVAEDSWDNPDPMITRPVPEGGEPISYFLFLFFNLRPVVY